VVFVCILTPLTLAGKVSSSCGSAHSITLLLVGGHRLCPRFWELEPNLLPNQTALHAAAPLEIGNEAFPKVDLDPSWTLVGSRH
jgi:hypothetical protein